MAGSGPTRGQPSAPLARIVAGAVIGLAVAVALGWWTVRLCADLPRVLTSAGPADPADALLRILAAAALAVGTWLAATTTLAYLVELPALAGSRMSRTMSTWTPRIARRIVGATLGGALLGLGTSTSALAEPTPPPTPSVSATVQTPGSQIGAPDPSFVPLDAAPTQTPSPAPSTADPVAPSPTTAATTKPGSGATSAPAPTPSPTPSPTTAQIGTGTPSPDPSILGHRPARGGRDQVRTVTVHRGDTLWGIAAAHLGPHASEADIAREWPRWYAANRAVIGDDPDLILAGQVLVIPAGDVTPTGDQASGTT